MQLQFRSSHGEKWRVEREGVQEEKRAVKFGGRSEVLSGKVGLSGGGLEIWQIRPWVIRVFIFTRIIYLMKICYKSKY